MHNNGRLELHCIYKLYSFLYYSNAVNVCDVSIPHNSQQ